MSYLKLKMTLQPLDAISDRAKTDGTSVSSWTFSDDAGLSKDTAAGKDVALVFITADSGYVFCTLPRFRQYPQLWSSEASYTVEGNAGDRNDLQAWHSGVSSSRTVDYLYQRY